MGDLQPLEGPIAETWRRGDGTCETKLRVNFSLRVRVGPLTPEPGTDQ